MKYRQIKFRVYNKKTKKWIYGPHANSSIDGVNLFGETIMFGELLSGVSIEDYNECVALQFTGLKDSYLGFTDGTVIGNIYDNPDLIK